jgi:hypothetical protein
VGIAGKGACVAGHAPLKAAKSLDKWLIRRDMAQLSRCVRKPFSMTFDRALTGRGCCHGRRVAASGELPKGDFLLTCARAGPGSQHCTVRVLPSTVGAPVHERSREGRFPSEKRP